MNTESLSAPNRLVHLALKTLGQSSDSIRLGFQRGFDSGEMMDRIYQNRPSGRLGIGWLADLAYLNQIGCQGLRGRKVLLKSTLLRLLARQRGQGAQPVIVDVAAGPATYLVEVLAEAAATQMGEPALAIARDLDRHALRRGEALAREHQVDNVRFEHANAFDEGSLLARRPRPTIAVASGFYEILTDDELIRRSMRLIRRVLPDTGAFIFTTQVHHPQLELIKALPNRDGRPWEMKNRGVEEVEAWARAAGFTRVDTHLEPCGVFGVSVAS